jgi:hypothetical protein
MCRLSCRKCRTLCKCMVRTPWTQAWHFWIQPILKIGSDWTYIVEIGYIVHVVLPVKTNIVGTRYTSPAILIGHSECWTLFSRRVDCVVHSKWYRWSKRNQKERCDSTTPCTSVCSFNLSLDVWLYHEVGVLFLLGLDCLASPVMYHLLLLNSK